ncbi:two-component regulator propeller domain-containing protein [uncultured Draconibacterium sp.]|uniref:ligand-binding sensor domain-containing protein n=1 Tax=uncultured Draconibacterium sp. TaxID=1573823 RepID=UPI002AA682C4|nr:two-component regulator propeller domain-containing protein [uncultured Draconibacterium sp.]
MKQTLLILLFILPVLGICQVKRIGTPNILNYPKAEYKAGTQNWGIAQDPDGFMYFANNDGLLRFDGKNWELFPVSTTPPTRSICIDKEGTIYLGFDDDFGIFTINNESGPQFTSLKSKLSGEIAETGIIWKIHDTPFGIVFQSNQYLFILNDGKITTLKPETAFNYSFYVNSRLFLHEPGVGLFEYINGFINKVPWADELQNTEILSIESFFENQLLIGTAQNGWFEYKNGKLSNWDTQANSQVEKDILYSAIKLDRNNLAIGTILNGVIIANSDGNIVQHINEEKGIQNNTILSLYNDNSGNLWLGLDNGIDYIELNSPLSYISGSEGISTGYCCTVYNNKLYLGTNRGLFVKTFNPLNPNNSEDFKLVPNTEGQVWSLQVINDQLLCGHHSGTFVIEENHARQISNVPGSWKFVQLAPDTNYMIGGNYNGLCLYHYKNNSWSFVKKIKNFSESSRFLTQDESGNIWISHGSRGVFQVELNEKYDSVVAINQYGQINGLPSDDSNVLLTIDGNWYISAIDGIYQFNASNNRFEKEEQMNSLFNFSEQLKFTDSDAKGNYWYITDANAGFIHKNEDGTFSRITTPFRPLRNTFVPSFEFLCEHGNDNVFIATQDGFVHYSSRIVTSSNQTFKSFITHIDVPYLDTTIFNTSNNNVIEFPFNMNAFRFHFSAPSYQNPQQLEFSYFIDNYSSEWSPWTTDNYRDFTNFHENEYVIRVKARNSFGEESEEASYSFIITPPWQRSKTAIYIYVFLIFVCVVILAGFISKRFEKSKQKEREKHKQEMRDREKEFEKQAVLAEKEIIRLKNEKLEAQKLSLDKELANQTLSIVNKNKFLMKINQELKRLSDETTDGAVKSKMAILKKRINKEIDNQHQNKIFESYFEEVHADFFDRLKERFPKLTPKDLRLCAYIRMNMSTKEIASLLNISNRGVEISRYRLRKKLDLSRDINLSTFLLNL